MRLNLLVVASCALLAVCVAASLALAAESTRAEYTAQVEPICQANTQANERILAGIRQEVRGGKLKLAAAKFLRASAALEGTVEQLRDVAPPPADRARIAKWLGSVELESRLFATVAEKLRAGQKGAAQHLVAKLTVNANQTNVLMLPFEFHYCRLEPAKFT